MTVQVETSDVLSRAFSTVQEYAQKIDFSQATKALVYWSGRSLVDLFAHLALQIDVVWDAPFPAGPKIVAVNHPTTTDPFYMLGVIPGQMSLLITDMAFAVPVFGAYLRAAGHVPVIEGLGRLAFKQAVRRLRDGQTIGIFPEGALSPLCNELGFHPAHTGVARLALSTGAPIVPVGISLDPRHIRFVQTDVGQRSEVARWYLDGPYAVTIGEAVYLDGDIEDREWVRLASQRVMQRIERLSGASARRLGDHRFRRTVGLGSFPRRRLANESM